MTWKAMTSTAGSAATIPSGAALESVDAAIGALRVGGTILLVDDLDGDGPADLVRPAQSCDAAAIAFLRRHGRGTTLISMPAERMATVGRISSAEGPDQDGIKVSPVSPDDEARHIRLLADDRLRPPSLALPPSVDLVAAHAGGVLVNAGHSEAAVDLCRLAGFAPVAVHSELAEGNGHAATRQEVRSFAREREVAIVSVRDLIAYRMARERLVEVVSHSSLPTKHGTFGVHGYRVHGTAGDLEQIALTLGNVDDGRPVLVRVQTACFAADVLGSLSCDCRARSEVAVKRIAEEGRGVLVHLRPSAGSTGPCPVQLRRAEMAESGQRTPLQDKQREYGIGAQILRDLGVHQMRLLTNHQHELASLYGLQVVERVRLDPIDLRAARAADPAVSVNRESYRALAGSFPTGVTIVTTTDPIDQGPCGLTSQTFVGLSTEPPLVMVALAKSSRTVPPLLRSRAFVVNFLRHGAEALSDLFASKQDDKFEGIQWLPSRVAAGAPILRDHAVAYAECTVVEVHEAGDHWIFVGRVDGGEMLGGTPLLYYHRTYAPWPGI